MNFLNLNRIAFFK